MERTKITAQEALTKYYAYGCDEEVWKAFKMMEIMDIMSADAWKKFYNTAKDWRMDGVKVVNNTGAEISFGSWKPLTSR